jgi:hypothetical protein
MTRNLLALLLPVVAVVMVGVRKVWRAVDRFIRPEREEEEEKEEEEEEEEERASR